MSVYSMLMKLYTYTGAVVETLMTCTRENLDYLNTKATGYFVKEYALLV